VFEAAIRANSETNYAKLINLFRITLRVIVCDWCNKLMGDYLDCIFVEVQLTFVKGIKKLRMMNKFTYSWKTWCRKRMKKWKSIMKHNWSLPIVFNTRQQIVS